VPILSISRSTLLTAQRSMCRMQQIVPAASAAHVPSARVQAGQARKARKGLYKQVLPRWEAWHQGTVSG
jgi:hypothetical protein